VSHFRCEFDVVQRSRGGSAQYMSGYQSRGRIVAACGKITADYSSRGDHVATLMLAPADAPDWVWDWKEFWRRAALAEKRWDAQEARIVQLSLPRGLSRLQWVDVARKIGRKYVARGLVVQVDIHCTVASDGGENPHLHFLISMRALDGSVFAANKDRDCNKLFHARAHALRAEFAEFLNAYCKTVGVAYHADPRSNVDRGLPPAEPNLLRWNFSVYKKTGRKPPLLEQRDGERALREKIASREAECRELEREIALLSELTANVAQNISGVAKIKAGTSVALRDKAGPDQRISLPKIRLAASFENARGTDPPQQGTTISGAIADAEAGADEASDNFSSWRP